MTEQVEVSSLDLRFQGYRLRNPYAEKQLLLSVMEHGIRDPMQGVSTKDSRILLNGFKRYRCAQKLGIGIVPYQSLAEDEALGIVELLRIANEKSLSILEQAKLIDELRETHGLCNREIAQLLEKSKAWVSVRVGIIGQMPAVVVEKIMKGDFPAYSYLYTLRQFMRLNPASKDEVATFVRSVAGKGLSTRDIETLAHGYFKGPEAMHQQITNGNIAWALSRLKHGTAQTPRCSEPEQAMLRDLEIVQKYLCRIISKSQDEQCKSPAYYAQANLLSGGILRQVEPFSQTIKDLYDRSRQAPSDLPAA